MRRHECEHSCWREHICAINDVRDFVSNGQVQISRHILMDLNLTQAQWNRRKVNAHMAIDLQARVYEE